MGRFLIRNAEMRDLEGVHRLAHLLNTMNLPDAVDALREVIGKSIQSFNGLVPEPMEREYLFVVEDTATHQVVGTSQIIAQHGTRESPHIFYDVNEVEHYSESIDRLFRHKVLRLGYNYDGPTEVGGLIVDPEFRHGVDKLGKQLSFVRFLFIGMNPTLFRDRLLAELLPPLSPTGQSLLWEALGRRFTGLNYIEADHISRTNKEFIKGLFPAGQVYTCLFSEEVRSVIGAVGKPSEAAQRLLSSIGFSYQNRVDPFDGGPHFEAKTAEVLPVKETRMFRVEVKPVGGPGTASKQGLIAAFGQAFTKSATFRALCLPYSLSSDGERVCLEAADFAQLQVESGGSVHVLEFNGH